MDVLFILYSISYEIITVHEMSSLMLLIYNSTFVTWFLSSVYHIVNDDYLSCLV